MLVALIARLFIPQTLTYLAPISRLDYSGWFPQLHDKARILRVRVIMGVYSLDPPQLLEKSQQRFNSADYLLDSTWVTEVLSPVYGGFRAV